jgi:hypothetical protein
MFRAENWDMQSASEAEPAPTGRLEVLRRRTFDPCRLWVIPAGDEAVPDVSWVTEPEPLLAAAAAA